MERFPLEYLHVFTMCVCLSTWGSRVTITHGILDLTGQGPLPQPWPCPLPDMGPHWTGTPSISADI